jgi:hypothetical protein
LGRSSRKPVSQASTQPVGVVAVVQETLEVGVPVLDDAGQVQVLKQGVEVGGEGVVVVAGRGLAGPAEPVERVPVDQHHRLTAAVIFVVDPDVGAVLGAHCDIGHDFSLTAGMAVLCDSHAGRAVLESASAQCDRPVSRLRACRLATR